MKMRNELNRHLYVQKTSNIERLPYNVEQGQYADICSGDMEAVERGLSVMEQRIFLRQLSDDPARNALLHLVIVASDTAKACVDSGMDMMRHTHLLIFISAKRTSAGLKKSLFVCSGNCRWILRSVCAK